MKILSFKPPLAYPHTLPHVGRGSVFIIAFVHNAITYFLRCQTPPTSVGFMARAAPYSVEAALAKNLPHRSRENEFTDGRVGTSFRAKGRVCPLQVDGLKRVLTTG